MKKYLVGNGKSIDIKTNEHSALVFESAKLTGYTNKKTNEFDPFVDFGNGHFLYVSSLRNKTVIYQEQEMSVYDLFNLIKD
jgi:hypothetical protein